VTSRTNRCVAAGVGFVLVVGVSALGPSARASEPIEASDANATKQTCVTANGDAQALRLEGKLGAARELFVKCVDPSCPALVRDDCAQRLDELERVQPTIVLEVKDANGADATGVALLIDGRPLPGTLQGRALRVDPGEHELEFSADGFAPAKRRFVLSEGEKDRRERIVLERLVLAPPPPPLPLVTEPAAAPLPPEPRKSMSASTQQTIGLAVGGVGVVAIAVGSVFGVLTFSSVAAQNRDCGTGPFCADRPLALSDHAKAVTDGAVSTGTFIAGAALIAGGAALVFTPRSAKGAPSAGLRLAPTAGVGSAGLSLRGEF
jgi:hypothetical protein